MGIVSASSIYHAKSERQSSLVRPDFPFVGRHPGDRNGSIVGGESWKPRDSRLAHGNRPTVEDRFDLRLEFDRRERRLFMRDPESGVNRHKFACDL